MSEPRKIQVEIGVPAQIEPGQEVEIESVPGIESHRIAAGLNCWLVEIKSEEGTAIRGMNIVGRNAGELP